MKKSVKIWASLMVVLSLFCQIVSVNAASTEKTTAQDFVNNVYEADVLKLLGIIDEYSAENDWSNDKVTRGEVIAMTAVLAGYENNMNLSTTLPYTDIYNGYEYSGQLKYIYDMGFLPSAELLKPDESADFNFTVKLVLYALGYKTMIDIKGDNSAAGSAYRQVSRGIQNGDFSRKDVYHMFFEALSADYLSFSSIEGGNVTYKKDVTVLEDRFHAYFVKDKVNATQFASLDGSYTNRQEVKIGDEVYSASVDVDEYFGCEVNALVFEDDFNDCVEYLYKTREEDETIFSGRDFISMTRSKISYSDKKGKTRNISLSNPILVYNGENVSGSQYNDSLFEFTDGTVTVVSDGSKGYLVKVSAFDNMIIGGIDTDESTVYSKNADGKKVELDEEDDDKRVRIYNQEGKRISLEDLKTNTLLTFSKSISGDVVKAYMSENIIEGSFSNVDYDGGVANKVTVDEDEYMVSDSVTKKNVNINVRDFYLIYINCFDSIGALETKTADSSITSYILGAAAESGLADNLKIKFVESTDIDVKDAKILYTQKRIRVDGSVYKDKDQVISALSKYNGTTELPAVIKINSDNLIYEIDTPYYDSRYEKENSLMPLYVTDMTTALYHRQITFRGYFKSVFDMRYYMNLSSLTINKSITDGSVDIINNVRDDSECKVDLFGFGKDTSIAEIAISYDDAAAGNIPVTSKLYIVTDIVRALNNDEDVAYRISLTDGEKDYSYFVLTEYENDFEKLNLGDGDFIKIGLNGKNEIGNIKVLFDIDNISDSIGYISSTDKTVDNRYAIGILAQVENANSTQILKFALDSAITNFESTYIENKPYLIEVGRRKVTVSRITASELRPYDVYGADADIILNKTSYMYPGQVYVIRKD